METTHEWLTTEEALSALGICRITLWRYIKKGLLHPQKSRISKSANLFRSDEVQNLLIPQPASLSTSN